MLFLAKSKKNLISGHTYIIYYEKIDSKRPIFSAAAGSWARGHAPSGSKWRAHKKNFSPQSAIAPPNLMAIFSRVLILYNRQTPGASDLRMWGFGKQGRCRKSQPRFLHTPPSPQDILFAEIELFWSCSQFDKPQHTRRMWGFGKQGRCQKSQSMQIKK